MLRISDEDQEELRPVAVSLRNYFAPRSIQPEYDEKDADIATDANADVEKDADATEINGGASVVVGDADGDGDSDAGRESDEQHNDSDGNEQEHKGEGDVFFVDDEDENDDAADADAYMYPSSTKWFSARRRRGAIHEALTPLSMEVSVPHSLLVKLKHSYRCKELRKHVSQLFNLEDASVNASANVSPVASSNGHGKHLHGHETKKGGSGMYSNEHRFHVVCSKILQDNISSHPMWDHMDECLDDLYDKLPEMGTRTRSADTDIDIDTDGNVDANDDEKIRRGRIWKDICNAMRIQCRTITTSTTTTNMTPNDHESRGMGAMMNNHHHYKNGIIKYPSGSMISPLILTATSLNPKQLKQLPKNETKSDPGILGISRYTTAMPSSLPTNSLIVYFSDGSTRVHPDLYQLLVTKKVITEQPGSDEAKANSEDIEVDKFAKRFDDNVFDVLENESKNNEEEESLRVKLKLKSFSGEQSSYRTKSTPSPNHADVTTKMDIMNIGTLSNGHGNGIGIGHQSTKGKIQKHAPKGGSFADAFDSLTSSTSGQRSYGASLVSSAEPSDTASECDDDNNMEEEFTVFNHNVPLNDAPYPYQEPTTDDKTTGGIINIDILDAEIVRLHHVLAAEEEALKRETREQQERIKCLERFVEDIDVIRKEITEIDTETLGIIDKRTQIIEENQEILLRQLKEVYPIHLFPDGIYSIRGIHLPNDMHSLSASDEIISAGLGFACHVLSMCSKYLSIPLRYRLICNSSRSAIREDDFDVFPLFKERVVEKEQFDRAIVLFHRNIDHLLRAKGVATSTINERKHILAKLSLLFEGKKAKGSS